MTVSKYLSYVGAAFVFVLIAPIARAQEAGHDVCQPVGNAMPQPLGDREGHNVFIGMDSCKVLEGPLAGAVATDNSMWEWDGPKGTLLSSNGFAHKPGAFIAYQATDGKIEIIMTDGKPTGWTASGHNQVNLATGSVASLQGKSGTWTAKSTGPNEYEINYTFK